MSIAKVNLWGRTVGYLSETSSGIGFQYDKDFLSSNIQISPLMMPLSDRTFSFPALNQDTFHGLPGLFADSLPDKFGNKVIKNYIEKQGKTLDDISIIERLCFTGNRGMGAIEYEPSEKIVSDEEIDINLLKNIANDILLDKKSLEADDKTLTQLFQSSSSVGGARAKTLVAYNESTGKFKSGQINAGEGYSYWLLKFDGITNNKDKDMEPDKQGYTNIEYAYYLMALDCGIKMTECRLFNSNNLQHFMTRRFDRELDRYRKIHMQTLGAISHYDYNDRISNSYENAFFVLRKLNLPYSDFLELFRRMVFNVCMVNHDDHVKNFSFLMDRNGQWSLSPAYDLTFSYNPNNEWLKRHLMSINGKNDEIIKQDLIKVAEIVDIRKSDAKRVIETVEFVKNNWLQYCEQAEVIKENAIIIKNVFNTKCI